MKPTDVTDEMVERVRDSADLGHDSESSPKEIIAASVNAFLGDPTPITAEWLLANRYVKDTEHDHIYRHGDEDGLVVMLDPSGTNPIASVSLGPLVLMDTQTIGQLRALEIGLGITPCQ